MMHAVYLSIIIFLIFWKRFDKKVYKKRFSKMNSQVLQERKSKEFYEKKYKKIIAEL